MLTKDVGCIFITGADFTQVFNLDQHRQHHCTGQKELILIQSALAFADKRVTPEATRRSLTLTNDSRGRR